MISKKRLNERIEELSKISELNSGEGVTRRALSTEDKEAQNLVKSWMEQAGMWVKLDPAGNLIGRKEGKEKDAKPIVIGSHIDSVVNGGKFDGTVGVIGGIEFAQHLFEEELEINKPLEVIAFCEEEGSRFFTGGLYGSLAMTGKITEDDLEVTDSNGITRRKALEGFGLNPNDIFTEAVRKKGDIDLYLEMHIEQGPFLEQQDTPVGIVNGINGRYFGEIEIVGTENHVGGTPMNMRNDALLGASEIAIELEKIAVSYGAPAVGTAANMIVFPGEPNVIPGRVVIPGIDIRDLDIKRVNAIVKNLKDYSKTISKKRNLSITFNDKLETDPALSNKKVMDVMKEKSDKLNIKHEIMPSGSCHDAQLIASIAEIGFIFIRSTGGSHNPNEHAEIDDIVKGTELLSETALHFLNDEV